METISRIRAVGGSLMVTIPKDIVKEESLQNGQIVTLEIKKIRKSGFGLLKGIGPFTKNDELKGQLEE